MKQFFNIFLFFIFVSGLALGQVNANDNKETLLEQAMALLEEKSPIEKPNPTSGILEVTHPLFIAVDDVTVPAYVGKPATNEWLQALIGYQFWGAAFDVANNKIYFNNGSTLYEWPVGGTVTQLGTIVDTLGATQSVVSLAFFNGELYATKNISNEAVYKINTSTLVARVYIDYIDADFDFGGLAIDQNTGIIYATNDDTTPFGSGLFRINTDGSGALIAAYPAGQTDIDGLAVSNNGIAYLIIDEPGDIFVYDLIGGTYLTPLTNPWTSSEVFSSGTWIYESGGLGLMLINDGNTAGTDSVEAWLNVLAATYTRFDVTTALGMPTSDWLMYDALLWVGIPSSGAEHDSVIAYCNGGGNFGTMDNDIGYSYGSTSFFQDYLMSIYISDAGSDGTITGLDMMDGLTLDISADPYPDDIMPNIGAYGTGVPIFLAPTTTTYSGMRGDGGSFRTQLLCWDPQYGASYTTNLAILSRTIDWLVYAIIPVELSSFTASVSETNVTLNWVTASETNNQGFEIERNDGNGFQKIGFVPGFGTTTETRSYSYTDAGLPEGTYSYRLKQIDFNGMYEFSEVVEVEIVVPDVYSLAQNYPNPFNPATRITFSLAVDSKVSLKIFDVLGQEVASIVNQDLIQGVHTYDFNATGINSGVYFYKIEATGVNGNEFVDVKKMILVK
jgi:hypothetical protein